MIFNSLEFLIFFPIVLLGYFLLPKRMKWVFLLAASYFFYMIWNPPLIFLILFTTLVSYIGGIRIERSEKKSVRKFWLIATLVTSLGVLFFFKYFNFLADSAVSLANLFGADADFVALRLILPVGISFYTFQTLSYVIDIYRGDIKAETHFGWYALFVSFFPQLVAGPIERPENLLPQLKEDHRLEAENAYFGLRKMAVGFFKKIVVADLLAEFVNAIYNNAGEATGLGVIIASALFSVQIYCDFSGYTDIAIGCARVMGIRLMQNFNRPYSARSIKEFWARWHISLSSWFKDYIYIPLGGNRCSKPRRYFNIFVVFFVSGFWHGASWTFVLWGMLHGVYQIIGALTLPLRTKLYEKLKIDTDCAAFAWWQKTVTFTLVALSWLLFRANAITDTGILTKALFTSWEAGFFRETMTAMNITPTSALIAIFATAIMVMLDRICEKEKAPAKSRFSLEFTTVTLAITVAVAWMLLLSVGGASAFIYFQF